MKTIGTQYNLGQALIIFAGVSFFQTNSFSCNSNFTSTMPQLHQKNLNNNIDFEYSKIDNFLTIIGDESSIEQMPIIESPIIKKLNVKIKKPTPYIFQVIEDSEGFI
jgi:hypothetical protein